MTKFSDRPSDPTAHCDTCLYSLPAVKIQADSSSSAEDNFLVVCQCGTGEHYGHTVADWHCCSQWKKWEKEWKEADVEQI